jgi:hypothetical protein
MRNNSEARSEIRFYTSGDPEELKALLPMLLGEFGEIQRVEWLSDLRVRSRLAAETRRHGEN